MYKLAVAILLLSTPAFVQNSPHRTEKAKWSAKSGQHRTSSGYSDDRCE
jgi:hypothetical protein